MNQIERGFLLLAGKLGNPERQPLTVAQLRLLALRARKMNAPIQDRNLSIADLTALGIGNTMAQHVVSLLSETELLDVYLERAEKAGCVPITRANPAYPFLLRQRLGLNSPGCLWVKGNAALLCRQGVALVGSRDLSAPNRLFAQEVGIQAARQGMVLISGNARGADSEAQNACLNAGGAVISVVADALNSHVGDEKILYISEEDFDAGFSSYRALSRNRLIHSLGESTFVAQCRFERGGTWDGTVKNLQNGWSPVFCFRDGSKAGTELEQRGAQLIDISMLRNFHNLKKAQIEIQNFF